MKRALFDDEHEQFRQTVRRFVEKRVVPAYELWEEEGIVPRDVWEEAGEHGMLGIAVPEEYGGGGIDDFRFSVVLAEELQRVGAMALGLGVMVHNDVVLPYLCRYATEEVKERWLPRLVTGEAIGAVAMTEPSTGSDLSAIRTTAIRGADGYVVNGAKTFITNGIHADVVVTAVKTDPTAKHRGVSLLALERGMAGFERGRKLQKLGLHSQDTAELFFYDVDVPAMNLLGEEGQGFEYLVSNLPRERLGAAVGAVAAGFAALGWTVDYCGEREAFSQPIGQFQHTRFVLAELRTELEIGQVFVDRCTKAIDAGELTPEDAAMAKWWTTELHKRVVDACLQLHGGYGYMAEYPIARAYRDARVLTIAGGTTEIMKEIIGRATVG